MTFVYPYYLSISDTFFWPGLVLRSKKSISQAVNFFEGVTLRKSTCVNLLLIFLNLLMLENGYQEMVNISLDVASNLVFDLMLSAAGWSALPWLQEDSHHSFFEMLLEITI